MEEDIYDLDELIERLEEIRDGFSSKLNHPKAFLSLATEIKKIKQQILAESQAASSKD
jgi:hypothetical protein